MSNKSPTVMLVEDSDADRTLITAILSKLSGGTFTLVQAADGRDALDLLSDDSLTPNLIILDLNMPGVHGFEVLDFLKSGDDRLRKIPVIVFTTSRAMKDRDGSYLRHAAAFMTKPLDLKKFKEALSRLSNYWLGESVHLP